MAGGGKGGESRQQIDPALTAAARDALDFAYAGAAIPYSPNRGVTIAGFTPQQLAAFNSSNEAAEAFGLATGEVSLPATETAANGIQGYSTGELYDENRDASVSPGLQRAISQLFANPRTGAFSGPGGPLFRGEYAAMPATAGGGGK